MDFERSDILKPILDHLQAKDQNLYLGKHMNIQITLIPKYPDEMAKDEQMKQAQELATEILKLESVTNATPRRRLDRISPPPLDWPHIEIILKQASEVATPLLSLLNIVEHVKKWTKKKKESPSGAALRVQVTLDIKDEDTLKKITEALQKIEPAPPRGLGQLPPSESNQEPRC